MKMAVGAYKLGRQMKQMMAGKEASYINDRLWLGTVRNSLNARGIFRFGGSFWTAFGSVCTPACAMENGRQGVELRKKYIDSGQFMDDGADNGWSCSCENSHFGHLEELAAYDPADPDSSAGVAQYIRDSIELSCRNALGLNMNTGGNVINAMTGLFTCGYDKYLRAIKKGFDPNDAADGSMCVEHQQPTQADFLKQTEPAPVPVPDEKA